MSWLGAVLAALAAWILVPDGSVVRRRLLGPRATRRAQLRARPVGIIAGLAVCVLWWSVVGVVVGIGVAIMTPRLVARLETRSDRRRRQSIARQAPIACDVLSACLASGAPLHAAVAATATAIGSPLGDDLEMVAAALVLGASPEQAWSAVDSATPALGALVRSVIRSSTSGAPVADIWRLAADDLRRTSRARAQEVARAAGVRAIAPLAACFLPGFVLLGVVPVVAALAAPLLTLR